MSKKSNNTVKPEEKFDIWRLRLQKLFAGIVSLISAYVIVMQAIEYYEGKRYLEMSGIALYKDGTPVDGIIKINAVGMQETETDANGKFSLRVEKIKADSFLIVATDRTSGKSIKVNVHIDDYEHPPTLPVFYFDNNPSVHDLPRSEINMNSARAKREKNHDDINVSIPNEMQSQANEGQPSERQTKENTLPSIHNESKGNFAVYFVEGNNVNFDLNAMVTKWLISQQFTVASSFFKPSFLQQGYFKQIMQEDLDLLKTGGLEKFVSALCLGEAIINLTESEVLPGVFVARAKYNIKVISVKDKEASQSIKIEVTGSGVSKSSATTAALNEFLQELNQKSVSL